MVVSDIITQPQRKVLNQGDRCSEALRVGHPAANDTFTLSITDRGEFGQDMEVGVKSREDGSLTLSVVNPGGLPDASCLWDVD